MCFGDFLEMRTLCDAYHKEFGSHYVLSWTYLDKVGRRRLVGIGLGGLGGNRGSRVPDRTYVFVS